MNNRKQVNPVRNFVNKVFQPKLNKKQVLCFLRQSTKSKISYGVNF